MKYPTCAEIGGEKYPINTDWRVGVRCLQICNDPDISDTERALAIVYKLFGFIPDQNAEEFVDIAVKYLSCGETQETHSSRPKDMDFKQDERYIAASFRSDYGIELFATDMHFWEYYDLVCGLTDKCVLSRVRDIRNYDVSDIKDPKQKRQILDAKKSVALQTQTTKEEQEAIDEFERLLNGGENT